MSAFTGEVLRERREALGLSLQDVHARIHVPLSHLRAFEDNRLDDLPAPAYAVGFLSTYCQLLELDPAPFVDRYRLCQHTGEDGADRAMHRQFLSALREPAKRPAWIEEVLAWGTICAILLFAWVAYATITRPFAERAETRVDAGAVEVEVLPFDVQDVE